MAWLAVSFFLVALCYSSVGFGGGSSYTAILAWQGVESAVIRQVSLLCNLVVVVIGGLAGWKRIKGGLIVPLLVGAIPAVYFAARWRLLDETFFLVLALALAVAGILLFVTVPEAKELRKIPTISLLVLGAALGALAGLTGIGGGIYLAPVLYLMRAGKAHEVAAVATCFIFVNSAVGFSVISSQEGVSVLREFLWLPLAVALGGLFGARLLQGRFHEGRIRKVTGGLVLLVAVRLMFRL